MFLIHDRQLKALIQDTNTVSKESLAAAEKEAKAKGKRLRDVLLAQSLIQEEELHRLEAYILGIPFVDLEKETIDPKVLSIIPEPIAKKNNIVAFKLDGKDLQVAMIDPADIQTIEFIKKKTELRILPRLTSTASIKHALQQYQKSLAAEFGELIKKDVAEALVVKGEDVDLSSEKDLKKMAEDLPVIRIVDSVIRHAILQQASDIHIEPQEHEVIVRYRLDGILHDQMKLPKEIAPGIVARIKVMSNLKLDEHRLPQDGRFKIETPEYKFSVRVSILPIFDGEKIVMRLLPEGAQGFSLEKLGFFGEMLERVHRAIRKPTGILLATGPTGSGKTTTLYTILDMLNTPGVNISTVEDPIEYRMPRVNQTQVRPEIGLSFANGLRALLRQDPNIIMVGEIRDNETAGLAINAALTGHLVLSTLHTNSASGALPRLLDMHVEPFLIASTVNAIIAQRLVRTLCGEKEMRPLTDAELATMSKQVNLDRILEALKHERIVDAKARIETIEWGHPKPSDQCPDGYHGRVGIHEVLQISSAIQELIMKNATADQIEEQGRKEGMLTMLEDGFVKAAEGITSLEEVLRVTSE
ncbi:MAG: type II/IV secretion system protein [Candidatus Sungbacteria bacterium]|uniref:Type II/IV secretion system protein n=1 Tax=Candidatus Sungiibacteriota bacterium TaxID=2750080 RepID=A0A931WPP2_9BACT|nr:type II/IV secretion system protein [Candidatus Sungbacteria bacterium]